MRQNKPSNQVIFLLEDHPGLGEEMKRFIERRGHTVLFAERIEEGAQMIRDAGTIDKAFVDKGAAGGLMRHRGGLDIAHELRQLHSYCQIFIMTGEDHLSDEVRASGADYFVPKPFPSEGLEFALGMRSPSDIKDATFDIFPLRSGPER